MVFILALLFLIPLTMLRGLVVSWLWLWFVVPLGVHEISVTHAIGLGAIITLLTFQNAKTNAEGDTPGEKLISSILTSVLMSLMVWGIGYVVHLCM